MAATVPAATSADAASLPVPSVRPRIDSLDVVRGAVMVLMALDHARDFFTNVRFEPTDLTQTWPALFFTRWVTHFCAPVFVFLAGTGAYLGAARGKTKAQLSWFLLTRGLWLALLELTLVHFGWTFDMNPHFEFLQVIWAIGISMIVLSGLVFLPTWAVGTFGVAMVLAHDLLDPIQPAALGKWAALFIVLHVQAPLPGLPPGWNVFIAYPLIPWVGVMAAGYAFGALYRGDAGRRRRKLLVLGSSMLALFVALRLSNLYGDPRTWAPQGRGGIFTLLAFLNVEKYPPSLDYLLVTLGPAILALALFEAPGGSAPASGLRKALVVYGRVPLFYYLLHLPLLHLGAGIAAFARYGPAAARFTPLNLPADFGYGLPVVYAVWIAAVVLLYPACAWFARLKSRRKDVWLSYL
jgi:uncharacterized membrane protein